MPEPLNLPRHWPVSGRIDVPDGTRDKRGGDGGVVGVGYRVSWHPVAWRFVMSAVRFYAF